MTCYIISYDLVKERDYTSLIKAIKSYEIWAKITESTWAIVTDKATIEVRDHLKACIDKDDKIIVVNSGGTAAWKDVSCSNEWLKKYI